MNNKKYKEEMDRVKVPEESIEKFKAITDLPQDETKITKVSFSKTKTFRKAVSIAASFAVLIGVVSVVGLNSDKISSLLSKKGDPSEVSPTFVTGAVEDGSKVKSEKVKTFESIKDLENYISKARKKNRGFISIKGKSSSTADGAVTNAAAAEGYGVYTNEMMTGSAATQSAEYAKTYTQEENVDEADIIKTRDNYIFYAYSKYGYGSEKSIGGKDSSSRVDIFRVKNGKETRIARIFPFETSEKLSLNDIYVTDERLIINATKYSNPWIRGGYVDYNWMENAEAEYEVSDAIGIDDTTAANEATTDDTTDLTDATVQTTAVPTPPESDVNNKDKTVTYIYDISDASSPKEISKFEQDGHYISSRMIGNRVYVVSDYNIFELGEDDFVPKVYSNGSEKSLDPSDISYIGSDEAEQYIIASEIDASSCERIGEPKAVLGTGWAVYCSTDNLYIYASDWGRGRPTTEITKLSLGNTLEFVSHGKISGDVNSQYSFSERNGKLFVCNTVFGKDEKESNVLRVLDENLDEIAKTEYFAPEESIKAVKYIGNYAYVITYEETDPLFVIDISDPASPKLLGHAIVSGFSTMLVDIGNDQLLGIGYCTGEYDYVDMEVTDGVKFTLFDVKDPLAPKVLDEMEFKNIYSDAQENPKAFVQNPSKGYYSISYTDNYEDNLIGALVVSVKDGKIILEKDFSVNRSDSWGSRMTYVGDWYYIIDSNAGFASFELK